MNDYRPYPMDQARYIAYQVRGNSFNIIPIFSVDPCCEVPARQSPDAHRFEAREHFVREQRLCDHTTAEWG